MLAEQTKPHRRLKLAEYMAPIPPDAPPFPILLPPLIFPPITETQDMKVVKCVILALEYLVFVVFPYKNRENFDKVLKLIGKLLRDFYFLCSFHETRKKATNL